MRSGGDRAEHGRTVLDGRAWTIRRQASRWRASRAFGAVATGAAVAAVAVLAPVAGATAPSPPAPAERPVVVVHGRADSFRGLTGATVTSSGHRVATRAVDGWRFPAGTSAFHTAITPAGHVVVGTIPQTDNQGVPTAATMSVVALDPSVGRASTLSLATTRGASSVIGVNGTAGGGDVSDLCTAGHGVGRRLLGVSAVPYHGWRLTDAGELPSVIGLRDGAAGVEIDPTRTRSASQLQLASLAGLLAFPPGLNVHGETVALNRGMGECERLPASGNVVVVNYFSDRTLGLASPISDNGSITVLDPTGRAIAFLQLPDQVELGTRRLRLAPRDVAASPRLAPGDERFVVVFDAWDAATGEMVAFPVQEFTFGFGRIAPRSSPAVLGGRRANTSLYAPDGTLFVATSGTTGWAALSATPLAVLAPATLHRVAPPPAIGLTPGLVVRQVQPDRWVPSTVGMQTIRSLTWDDATATVAAVSANARLRSFHWSGWAAGGVATARCDIDLGGAALRQKRPGDPATGRPWSVHVRHGVVDPASRTLWVPYSGLADPAPTGTAVAPNQAIDQYLFAVDLDQATAC